MTTEVDNQKALAEILDFVQNRAATQEELERVSEQYGKLTAEIQQLRTKRAMRVTDEGKIKVASGPFAGLTPVELSLARQLFEHRYEHIDELKFEEYREAPMWQALMEARASVNSAITTETVAEWGSAAINAASTGLPGMNRRAQRRVQENVGRMQHDLRKITVARAMDSTTTGKGDELVPTFETSELWMDINLATNVLPTLNQVPMPTQPYDIPLQFGDVDWYPITENVQSTTTDLTTAKSTLSAEGLRAGVPFSDELSEDSIVAFVPELRANLVRNAAEVIDNVLLNADTTVTNGINSDGATISKSDAGKAQWLLGWDGLRHLPLISNTGQSFSVGAAVAANATYNRLLRKLGKYAAAQVRGDVVYIADINTAIASLALDEVETVDKIGVRATISGGELASIYGVPLIQSEQLLLVASDGKVTDEVAGTVGNVLALNTTQWRVGFRRGITLETDREPGKGQTTLYASLRIALIARGTVASATHTALAYNITSVT